MPVSRATSWAYLQSSNFFAEDHEIQLWVYISRWTGILYPVHLPLWGKIPKNTFMKKIKRFKTLKNITRNLNVHVAEMRGPWRYSWSRGSRRPCNSSWFVLYWFWSWSLCLLMALFGQCLEQLKNHQKAYERLLISFDLFLTFFTDCGHIYVLQSTCRPHIGKV